MYTMFPPDYDEPSLENWLAIGVTIPISKTKGILVIYSTRFGLWQTSSNH